MEKWHTSWEIVFEQVMQKGVEKATNIVAPFVEKNKSICP